MQTITLETTTGAVSGDTALTIPPDRSTEIELVLLDDGNPVNPVDVRSVDLRGSVDGTQILAQPVTHNSQPDAMVVEGAGTESFNEGVYVRDGDFNGRPFYYQEASEGEIFWPLGPSPLWILNNVIEDAYEGATDTATPDLTSWTQLNGTAPAPTVRRATWADIDAAGIDRSTVPTLFIWCAQLDAEELAPYSTQAVPLRIEWRDRSGQRVSQAGLSVGIKTAVSAPADGNYRIKNGTDFQLRETAPTAGWRTVSLENGALQFGPLDES